MMKRTALFLCLIVFAPALVQGAEAVSVGILPYEVYSQEDLGYLKQGIQEMLGAQLAVYGVKVASEGEIKQAAGGISGQVDEKTARNLGGLLDVDYLIFGGLTKIGPSFSLDTQIVETLGLKKTARVFVQGDGLENLLAAVKEMAVKVALQVTGQQKIGNIVILGNERIEADAVKAVLLSKVGDLYSPMTISEDLKRIYGLNFFQDVKVDVEDTQEGKIVTFAVEEKPSIQVIDLRGNKMLEEKDLLEVLGFRLYSILDEKKVLDSVENLKKKYREKGYYNAEITYKVESIDEKKVAVRYQIAEKDKIYVKKIEFEGNSGIAGKKLLNLMETQEKGFMSWLTSSGVLDRNELDKDITKLLAYYHNNGYIKVQIAEPKVVVEKDGINITISINEGPQYRVGKVSLEGDLIVPEAEILSAIKIDEEKIFNREIIQKDMEAIGKIYNGRGYAYASVVPQIQESEESLAININYKITKNSLVYFERIEIVGNTRTREKVIRREFRALEQDLFSLEKLRLSIMNLQRLGFFKDVEVTQSKGSAEDRMNIRVEVEEQPTGAFSFGAGWSSYNKFFTVVEVSQNNLFGRGQTLALEGTFGERETQYKLSFVEPWLFDIPLSFSTSIYKTSSSYNLYDKDSNGASIGAGYPLFPYVRLTGAYNYDDSDIYNLAESASIAVQEYEGRHITSSVSLILKRDTRNRFFNATEGSNNSLAVEYAGGVLGGTSYFTKYVIDSGWFFPIWANHVFFIRGKAGLAVERPGGDLPIYEKFFLGGINSLRGFEWGSVSPLDPETGDEIGGEKMVLFNFEYIFPLIKEQGLMGVIFYDTGNAYTKDDKIDLKDLRESYGFGFRYYSPIGPLRLEYGRVINPRPGEDEYNWEFTMGSFF